MNPTENNHTAISEHEAQPDSAQQTDSGLCWYVMRDLKRANAKLPAYRQLTDEGFEVFTPMTFRLTTKGGKRVREKVPFMQDMLFVHAAREKLDAIVDSTKTLQYRYIRGAYCEPMTVREKDMTRFIRAVESTDTPQYYLPGELLPNMFGHKIRIMGGPLDGCEGKLLKVRGTKKKRLIVEIPTLLSVSVEVSPEYIQIIG